MKSFKYFITELHGKGSLKGIHDHHASKFAQSKKSSHAADHHSLNVKRAKRIALLKNKKIPANNVPENKKYNREDSKKSKDHAAKIKTTDYR